MAETEIHVSQIFPSVSAYQLVGTNASATANTYLTLAAGSNITITPSGTTLTIASTGGGSGSPASPDTSIQFNNAGAFGGSADLTYLPNFVSNSTTFNAVSVFGTTVTPALFLNSTNHGGLISFSTDDGSIFYSSIEGDQTGGLFLDATDIIQITSSSSVELFSSGKEWVFNTAGNLTTPGNIYVPNGVIGIGTNAPATSAALDITSSSQGFAMPRMGGSQRDAITSPVTGLEIFNTDTNGFEFWQGSFWTPVGPTSVGPFGALQTANDGEFEGNSDLVFSIFGSSSTLTISNTISGAAPTLVLVDSHNDSVPASIQLNSSAGTEILFQSFDTSVVYGSISETVTAFVPGPGITITAGTSFPWTFGNDGGLVFPSLPTEPGGVAGEIIYQSTANQLEFFNGTAWISLDFTLNGLPGPVVMLPGPNATVTTVAATTNTNYTLSGANAPLGCAAGPDGNMWFCGNDTSTIIRVTPSGIQTYFPTPTSGAAPTAICLGPDGNMWFTENTANNIGQCTPDGVITEFPITTPSSGPNIICVGSDGNLWFTEQGVSQIGTMTTAGAMVAEYATPTPSAGVIGICAGSDGNLWFVEASANNIGQCTTSGSITEFPITTPSSGATGICAGPDNLLYFTEIGVNQIGVITTSGGVVIEYPCGPDPVFICLGPDGNLWFTQSGNNTIAKITPFPSGGIVTAYAGPIGGSNLNFICVGPDKNIWYSEQFESAVGKFVPTNAVTVNAIPSGPGGALQFNNGNIFTGDPNLIWDSTDAILTIASNGATGGANIILKGNSAEGGTAITFEDNASGTQAQFVADYNNTLANANTLAIQTNFGPATLSQITLTTQSAATNFTSSFNPDGSLNLPNLSSQPGTPNEGEIIYNTTAHSLQFYNGTSWVNASSGVIARVALTAQGADIAATTLFTPTVTGLYQVSVYGIVVTSDAGANNSTVAAIAFNNDVGAQTLSLISMDLTTTSPQLYSNVQAFEAVSGVPVTYSVGVGGPYGAATYNLYITITQL